jgi:hypothetical protein
MDIIAAVKQLPFPTVYKAGLRPIQIDVFQASLKLYLSGWHDKLPPEQQCFLA